MRRSTFEAQQASLIASAVTAETFTVQLVSIDDTMTLRKLTQNEFLSVVTSAGDDDDREAKVFTRSLRYALLDEDGQPLLRSFEEAVQFVNMLSIEDFAAIASAFQEMNSARLDAEAVEAGKAP